MKKAGFALSTIIYMLCCLYYSAFCAYNSIDAVRDMLWDMPQRRLYLEINDGVFGFLFWTLVLCIIACALITWLTKADSWALVLWSSIGLFIITMLTVSFAESLFSVIAFLFLAETVYSAVVWTKTIKKM